MTIKGKKFQLGGEIENGGMQTTHGRKLAYWGSGKGWGICKRETLD